MDTGQSQGRGALTIDLEVLRAGAAALVAVLGRDRHQVGRAGRVEVRDFVLWMRFAARASHSATGSSSGYAPATINHNLAVLKGFYADRIEAGSGPLVNPVPAAEHHAGRGSSAHHNPMQPHDTGRRAPLRQKVPDRIPRSLPNHLFDALFAVAGCDRDRALLAFYVSC